MVICTIFPIIWDKVFKNGPREFFKGCFPQIILGPFFNTLAHIKIQLEIQLEFFQRLIQNPVKNLRQLFVKIVMKCFANTFKGY